nr:hypothetical protein [Tanacetum cinerariifolium]
MRTCSSLNLVGESSPNPTTSNLIRRNRRRSKRPFSLEESPLDTMTDQRTMAELLRAPTEGYAEAIVVPPILAKHFELKHSLTNMMTRTNSSDLRKTILMITFDRYKDLLRACPHHGFTELHQLDTFYNALNPADQDSLNSTTGGNLLERRTQDVLTITKTNPSAMTTAMTMVNYNQSNSGYRPSIVPLSALEKIKKINEVNVKAMQTQINNVKNEVRNEMKTSMQASMFNQTNELKNMMASFFQMNTASTSGSGPLPSNIIANPKDQLKAITTRSSLVLDGPSVPMPPPFIIPEEDECAEETSIDPKLANKKKMKSKIHKFWQMFKQLHINNTLVDALILIPKYQKMHKSLLSNKEILLELANTPLNENCSTVILKKSPEKLGDPGKFLIPCGFSELKCKVLTDLGASINLMPLLVWKNLVGMFTFPTDFVIVDYESDPRVPLILRRPFLWTACALIDVHGEEMILRDVDERLTLNMRHDFSSYSNQPLKESINMIDIYKDSYEDYLEDLLATNHLSGNPSFSSHTDLTSLKVINQLSGNTTSSSPDHLLEEFADELALITFSSRNDDILFDIKSDLREIEYLLNHDPTKEMDYILEDSVDEGNLADPNNDLVDTIPKMFTDEHTLYYSYPPLYDDVDDDLVELETRARGFVLQSLDLHILSFILGIQYFNLID